MLIAGFIALALFTPTLVAWRTCEEQEFCTNIRYTSDSGTSYSLTNLNVAGEVTGNIVNDNTSESFTFRLVALVGDTFRITIQDPQNPRFTPEADALNGQPIETQFSIVQQSETLIVLSAGEDLRLDLYVSPFKIELYRGNDLIVQVNDANRLVINTSETDRSLALDLSFPSAQRAYGIPQHAERLSLPSTGTDGLSAFRLFNVDHYGYPVLTRESLYGAIGVLYGIGTTVTSGIFWMNSAQTFVDISNEDDGVNALFISETGALELFLFGGPTLRDCVRQYTTLTGVGELPQYYNLGYHQCRYSYMSQEDVETVVAQFDNYNFPMDVIWLDIDYTYGYRYFTWNYTAFPEPIEMQNNVAATGRKMVAISDPHIKVDVGYHVYDQALENDFFIKYPDGVVFEGLCWPGLSSYIDFFIPDAQEWYGELHLLENFNSTTLNLFIWNDMNEPSVFEALDLTLPDEVLHYGGWEHRDVHNMYGMKQTQATRQGLLKRDPTQRPFILTRAHFPGSQRYAALWTGDNSPSWEHLRISIPMILTASLAGIAFTGADVGGFTDNVEDDLLQRWYQAGAWYPFYRGHSGSNTDRREPYLFAPDIQERIRESMRIRYRHIPYWYTLFFEHELTGDPIVRPLSYHYPEDASVLDIDTQWLIGRDIMAAPVMYENVDYITTYFPGGANEVWYDLNNRLLYSGNGNYRINVDMDSAPYYYRGGSIIFRKDDDVRNTEEQRGLPYHMYVCLDRNSEATGNIYIDDLLSFDYKDKMYQYFRFEFRDNIFSVEKIHEDALDADMYISNVYIYQIPPTKSGNIQNAKVTTIKNKISLNNVGKHFTLDILTE